MSINLTLCWQINAAIMLCRLSTVKNLMQGKLFQKCTHVLYCIVLSLGGNVNTRWISKPEMGSIFHINNQWNILVIGNYCVNYQIFQNSLLLTSSDTKRTLMHQFNSCLQIPPRVRRVYTTAINFPWITFLYGWDFREDCSEFIQSIFSTTVYRVIHKEWDFRDDCTTFLLSDFLHVRFSATCLFCCLSLDIP